MKRVVIGLSGGVDSSAAAYLLKQQGYEVMGLFMKNWDGQKGVITSSCTWEEDLMFAEMTAHKLNIPLYFADFSQEYKQRVVDYMFHEYERGRTPNPDVLCNKEIKFDLFASEANRIGTDYIATGHYCIKKTQDLSHRTIHSLYRGKDNNKEQSYFLCQITQNQLRNALFPLGHYYKSAVRKLAGELDLPTASRKDSQGICFIGKVDLPIFLQQKFEPVQGKIIQIPAKQIAAYKKKHMRKADPDSLCRPPELSELEGRTIGKHQGVYRYTIGQRKGINIGGMKAPLYVIGKDTKHNILYVGAGADHPGLFRKGLYIPYNNLHWIREDLAMQPGETQRLHFKVRYRQPLQKGTLLMNPKGAYILFDESQRAITPGQFAVWYKQDELVGSGIID
jgi:tRNA-uridine 2-sulfurtransferase